LPPDCLLQQKVHPLPRLIYLKILVKASIYTPVLQPLATHEKLITPTCIRKILADSSIPDISYLIFKLFTIKIIT